MSAYALSMRGCIYLARHIACNNKIARMAAARDSPSLGSPFERRATKQVFDLIKA